MGLLDVVGGMIGGGAGGGNNALLEAVMGMVTNKEAGGLGGLVNAFQQQGLGDVVQSWVGTGQNLPVSGKQLSAVLGSEQIAGLAAKLGMSPDQASSALSGLLPQVVDQLTPNGQMPQGGDLMSMGMDLLKGKLFG